MFNKTVLAIAAAVVFGSVSAALAYEYEAPENKIGDKYPFLEQKYSPAAASVVRSRTVMTPQVSYYGQDGYEAPENKIGDRYPLLEMATKPTPAGRYVASGPTPRVTPSAGAYGYETPENKLSDRYPLLEQQVAYQGGATRRAASRRASTTVR